MRLSFSDNRFVKDTVTIEKDRATQWLRREGLPSWRICLKHRMRDEQMPYHSLKRFRVRSDPAGIDHRNDHACVCDFSCVAAIPSNNPHDFCAGRFRISEGSDNVRTDVALQISSAN